MPQRLVRITCFKEDSPCFIEIFNKFDVYGASSLSEVVQFLRGEKAMEPVRSANDWSEAGSVDQELDFGEVKDQQHVKRAVEVAAAGTHNILTFGPIPRAFAHLNALPTSGDMALEALLGAT